MWEEEGGKTGGKDWNFGFAETIWLKAPAIKAQEEKKINRTGQTRKRGNRMPTSKKQLEKLKKVQKAKAEELSQQAAAGSEAARKKLKKLEKKLK